MNPTDVEVGLRAISDSLGRILTGTYSRIIEEALAQVRPAAEVWKKGLKNWQRRGTEWGYQISMDRPLEFQVCGVRGYETLVDLSCAVKWLRDPAAEPIEQNFTLRIWSLEKRLFFRQDLDAEQMKERLEDLGRRVMLRLHFDLANSGQEGPKYHIQVGGVPGQNEHCWLHPSMNLPRIAHPPADIVLICEMIAKNFFREEYRTIKTDPTWRGAVRDAQRLVLQEYFQLCYETVTRKQHDQSLLDRLWNEPRP
jgi:hypothetical protein